MTISRSDFRKRIMKYCADSERCTFDVLAKLDEWQVPSDEADQILSTLYAEKFIDDRRYAKKFVTEKWKADQWGRIKIMSALQQKKLDNNILQEAMMTIDDGEYINGLNKLLEKKFDVKRSENGSEDARRIMMFAISRGFEEEVILEWIAKHGYDEMSDS